MIRRSRFLLAPALALASASVAGSPAQTNDSPPADVNASSWPGTQGEVSIAVDRFDPRRLVAAAMNIEEGRLLTMASLDAGDTWTRALVPLSEGALHADPMVSFDSLGRAHLAVIPVGAGNVPLGIDVMHSDDGGASWSPSVRITKATGRDDKLALRVDDGPESRFRDRIHIAWKWPRGGIYYVSSEDRGNTFTRPKLIETARVSGLDLAVSASGDVYLGASDGEERVMRVMRSTDGGASFLPSVAVAEVRALWYTGQPSHCQRKSLVHASIAVDRTEGSRRGHVYLVWADYADGLRAEACSDACNPDAACRTEVFFTRSEDDGRSFTPPAVLPGQEAGSDRYFPWLRADPSDGTLTLRTKTRGPTRPGSRPMSTSAAPPTGARLGRLRCACRARRATRASPRSSTATTRDSPSRWATSSPPGPTTATLGMARSTSAARASPSRVPIRRTRHTGFARPRLFLVLGRLFGSLAGRARA